MYDTYIHVSLSYIFKNFILYFYTIKLKGYLNMLLQLLFKMCFIWNCIKIVFFYLKKIIFNISALK